MEEVWKDIHLASLHEHDTRSLTTSTSNFHTGTVSFQEYLAHPFGIHSSPTMLASASLNGPPPSPPALGLSSRPDFPFHPIPPKGSHHPPSKLPPFANKRFAESDISSEDRRSKRMIKNRESAARSRARKQAHTNELELELEYLRKENARLIRQQEQMYDVVDNQFKMKNTLYRTSTAPF